MGEIDRSAKPSEQGGRDSCEQGVGGFGLHPARGDNEVALGIDPGHVPSGENAASREVEETVYRFEGVSEVAVVGLLHPHWIEAVTAVTAVTAVIVRKPGHEAMSEAQAGRTIPRVAEHLGGA